MSLITTKSTEGNPASYVNRFKNTFEIHANAEIAVQEVVLNRAHKFVTGPNAKLYVRHGDSTNTNKYNTPQLVELDQGAYTPKEMAAHLQVQLNKYEAHPQWQGSWTCVAEHQNNAFHRFVVTAKQSAAVVSQLPTEAQVTLATGTATGGITYDDSTGVILASSSTTFGKCTFDIPISLNSGEVVFKVDSASDVKSKIHFGLFSPHINHVGNQYGAYVVSVDHDTGLLGIVHAVQQADAIIRFQEISYWDQPGNALTAPYDFVGNLGTVDHIKIKVVNEKVSVFVGTSGNPEATTVCEHLIAVNTHTYALYPFVRMRQLSEVKLISFKGMYSYDKDAAVLQEHNNSLQFFIAMHEATATFAAANYSTLKGVTAAGYLDAGTLLITERSDAYNVADASCAEELGFDTLTQPSTTNPPSETFNSTRVPERGSDEIMHVRLTGLTFQSQNGVTGGPSRILQPLTRFTDNKTHGRMHFVPPERTYLKLHNPNKLTVQEMQVDIVNSDEKVVSDLQAHTYVALHIR